MPESHRCPRCKSDVELVRVGGRPLRLVPRGADTPGNVYYCPPCNTCYHEHLVSRFATDDRPFNERVHERSTT